MAAVIPALNESAHIGDVVRRMPAYVNFILVVDDHSTDDTAAKAAGVGDARVEVIQHATRCGVGGATVTGMRRTLDLGTDMVVKVGGDGQMDPARIADLLDPLVHQHYDYAKGNRFLDSVALRQMPRHRLIGNFLLTFLTKLAAGYWHIFDPQNGFVAVTAKGQRLRAHLGQLRSVLIEALCPLLILAALLDCTHFVGWRGFVGRDAQIYSAVAGLWESGLMPYRDVYDFKPPGIFLAMRAGFPLWGHNAEALRRILMILTALSALVMYAGLRMAGYLIAAPFAALGIMTLVVPHPWNPLMQNPESIVAIFGTAAIGCAAAHQARPRAWLAVATGACLAAAMLGKQPAIFFSAPLMLQLWLWGSTGTWWKRLCYWGGRLFWAVAGFGAVVGLVAAYFAYRGALDALYQSVLVDGGRYVGLRVTDFFTPTGWRLFAQQVAPKHLLGWELAAGQVWPFFPFLAAILVLIPLTFTHPSRVVLLAWGWLVAMDCAVLVGAKPIGHQAIMAYPALALTVGIIFQLALGAALQPARRQLATALLLAIFIYGGIWFTAYVPQRMDAPLEPETDDPQTTGERIRAAAHPGDKLLVLGEMASVYLYAGQQPATRFIYEDPPNPRGNVERLQALKSLPDFVLIPPYLRNFLKTGVFPPEFQPWVETLAQHYDEWFIGPHNGSVYRRKTPLASHDEPQPEYAPGPGL